MVRRHQHQRIPPFLRKVNRLTHSPIHLKRTAHSHLGIVLMSATICHGTLHHQEKPLVLLLKTGQRSLHQCAQRGLRLQRRIIQKTQDALILRHIRKSSDCLHHRIPAFSHFLQHIPRVGA